MNDLLTIVEEKGGTRTTVGSTYDNDDNDDDDVLSNSYTSSSYSYSEQQVLQYRTEYAKYFKMLEVGVPIGWVEKMCQIDGKDPSVLLLDLPQMVSSISEDSNPIDENGDDDDVSNSEENDDEGEKLLDLHQMSISEDSDPIDEHGNEDVFNSEQNDDEGEKLLNLHQRSISPIDEKGKDYDDDDDDVFNAEEGEDEDEGEGEGEDEGEKLLDLHQMSISEDSDPVDEHEDVSNSEENDDEGERVEHDNCLDDDAVGVVANTENPQAGTTVVVDHHRDAQRMTIAPQLPAFPPQCPTTTTHEKSTTTVVDGPNKREREEVPLLRGFSDSSKSMSLDGENGSSDCSVYGDTIKEELQQSVEHDGVPSNDVDTNEGCGYANLWGLTWRSKKQPQDRPLPIVEVQGQNDDSGPCRVEEEKGRPIWNDPFPGAESDSDDDAGLELTTTPLLEVAVDSSSNPIVIQPTILCSPPLLSTKDESPGVKDWPLQDDPSYARYFLMLKAQIPMNRVRIIVELDGKDPAILDLDPTLSYASQIAFGDIKEKEPLTTDITHSMMDNDEMKTNNNHKEQRQHGARELQKEEVATPKQQHQSIVTSSTADDDDLPLAKDPEYSRYFLMLKARVPIDRVRGVVEMDGKDPSILLLDPKRSYASQVLDSGITNGENHVSNFDRDADIIEGNGLALSLSVERDTLDFNKAIEHGRPHKKGEVVVAVAHPQHQQYKRIDQDYVASHQPTALSEAPLVIGRSDTERVDIDALFARRAASLPMIIEEEKKISPPDGNEAIAATLPRCLVADGDTPSLNDDPAYSKYFKMLKMKLPLGAVMQAMVKDGKDATILELDHEKSLASQRKNKSGVSNAGPVLKNDSEYSKYFKMLKMKLPLGAVMQAMVKDGKDATILELDPEKSLASQRKSDSDVSNEGPAIKDDPEYSKYFKMLKMKLPLGAVMQAMVKDGKDATILELDHEKSLASQRKTESNSSDEGPALKNDPEYSKYFKMLKMKLPLGAVMQAMVKDGKDATILELDPEKSLASQRKTKSDVKQLNGKTPKEKTANVSRKRLFWNSIDESNLRGSLWAQPQSERTLSLKGLDYDEDEFASLFTSIGTLKATESKAVVAPGRQAKSKQKRIQLIDSRRQMNGSILLAKYKHDYVVLARKVNHLNSGNMDETELLALMQLLPAKDESLAIRSYLPSSDSPQSAKDDAISKLGECEQYMASMLDVNNATRKFEGMLYRVQFKGIITDLFTKTSCLRDALACVRTSDKFARLMLFALRLGNTMNTGAPGEEVAAITLDSLLKLHEAKAFDKKTSVLHYLVSIIEKNDKEVLNVSEDLLPALKAERIVADALTKSLGDLVKGLERLKMTMAKHTSSETDNEANLCSMEMFVQQADGELKRLSGELDASKDAFADLLRYFGENQGMAVNEFFSTLTRFIAMFESARADVRRIQDGKARKERMAIKSLKTKSAG